MRAQTAQVPRIAILDFFPSATSMDSIGPFREGLRELGYIEGRNIHVEYHSAEQRGDLAAKLAADFVQRRFDIIVAFATPAAHAVKSATTTIPIVIAVADALATGLVASLSRPGGNITGSRAALRTWPASGLSCFRNSARVWPEFAFLGAANDPNTRTFVQETKAAADSINVQLQPLLVTGPEEFEAAFTAMIAERIDGLIVQPLFVGHRSKLAELAARHRLPMIADQRRFAEAGALGTYGVDRKTYYRQSAVYVDKILKGAKPADLPVEQPTKFELIINLKVAKVLGLTVPLPLLARADEVIE